MIGYDQQPAFELLAPGQETMAQRIEYEIVHIEGPMRRAVQAENLLDDWEQPKAKL
jgi:coenzyme A diphosphatase NUDT7